MAAALQTQETDQPRGPFNRLIARVSDRAERFFLPEQHADKLIANSLEVRAGEDFHARVTRIAKERDELMSQVATRPEAGIVRHYHALNHALDRIGAEVELTEHQARELLIARRGLEEDQPGAVEIDRRLERHAQYTWAAHGHDFARVEEQDRELEKKEWDDAWQSLSPAAKLERVDRLADLEAQYLRNEIHDYNFDEFDARAEKYIGDEMLKQDRAWASNLPLEVYEKMVDELLDRRAAIVAEGPYPILNRPGGEGFRSQIEANEQYRDFADDVYDHKLRHIDHELHALRSIAPSPREAAELTREREVLAFIQNPVPSQTARLAEINADLRRHEAISRAPADLVRMSQAKPGSYGVQLFREYTPPPIGAAREAKAPKGPSLDGMSM